METLDPQKSSAKEAEVSQSTGAEAEETVGKDSTDAVRGEGQELSAGDERNVGVGEAGATADAEEEKSIDGDGHVAVEADCTPAGFVDPVVESGVEMEPSDGENVLPIYLFIYLMCSSPASYTFFSSFSSISLMDTVISMICYLIQTKRNVFRDLRKW